MERQPPASFLARAALLRSERGSRWRGHCYHVAARLAIVVPSPRGLRLCHGAPLGRGKIEGVRFGHAWVECGGLWAFDLTVRADPISVPLFYTLGQIDSDCVRRYTPSEVRGWLARTKQWGPWESDLCPTSR